nr:MAG: colicin V production protein [Pseudomonadota bacterium]
MTWVDYAVIAVLGVSALLGIWRGFIREVLALAGWIAAGVIAVMFAPEGAALLPQDFATPLVRHLLAAALVFVLVLVVAGLAGLLLSKLVRAVGLGALDRTLGGVFGFVRGALIVLVAVLLVGVTSLPREPAWREAQLRGPLETAAIAARAYLPEAIAERIRYDEPEVGAR